MPFKTKTSPYWQYDFQVAGRRFHGSCKTKDHGEAKAIEAEVRANANSQKQRGADYTLSEAVGTYFVDICQHQNSARTSKSQAATLLEVMGKPLIRKITNADVMRFVASRRAQVSNATVNRDLQFLGRALRHMAKFYEAEIPTLELKAAENKEPKERVRELTQSEQHRLFGHLRTDLHPMTKFALMTGARRSTITGLLWSDIDLDGGRMIFRLKGGDEMLFPTNNELRAMLGSLKRSNILAYRGHVFTFVDKITAERKAIPNSGCLSADFQKAVKAAEIADFRFHDLRHTFATRLLRQTQNLKLVSRLLGHKSLDSTMRYAHVLDDDLRRAMDDYSVMFGGESRTKSRTRL